MSNRVRWNALDMKECLLRLELLFIDFRTCYKLYSIWKKSVYLITLWFFLCISVYLSLCWICFLCTIPRIATSSTVLPWVACEAGYSAGPQPTDALKLYTCAEKRSRHFSTVCLDQCSLWRYALFESPSVGDLFLGPWLFPSVHTMGLLYLRILLLWDLASYFRQLYTIPLQPCLLLVLRWREMQSNRGETQRNVDPGKRLAGIRLCCW